MYTYIYIYILSQGHTCMWSNHLHLLNHVFAQELSDAKKREARRVKDTVDVGHLQLTACSRLA